MAKPAKESARKSALQLVAGVRGGVSLSDQRDALGKLSPSDAARAGRLAADILRHQSRADAALSAFVKRKPSAQIADILRLGTVELLQHGSAAHGVVDSAVNLARESGKSGAAAAGMVNAVLRKVSKFQGWDDLPPQPLPDWLRGEVTAAYGEEVTFAIEAAHQKGAALDLTVKPGGEVDGAEALPTGSYRLQGPVQVSALPGFEAGDWWVQDAAAALPVQLLEPVPGEHIADICAAPGGKTLQLAAAGARVTAVDISRVRQKRLIDNLQRCGLTAEPVVMDALRWRPEIAPDAILLDAPCSATGTLRRHPDLPFLRDGSGLMDLADLQRQLFDHAFEILKPGGRLVYAVCSLLPQEGEAQMKAALQRHSGAQIETPALKGVDAAWLTPEGGIRLRPDYWAGRGGMDGFYMARIRKPG